MQHLLRRTVQRTSEPWGVWWAGILPNADPATCKETYALLQGTSAAVPHVTGIAALALSKFGKLSTANLLAKLAAGATDTACPKGVYQPYPADMPAEKCTGTAANNAFFGQGRADAYATIK